ncbi:hypothetical protein [Microbacterium suwonense]|uniref:DUF4064 domain-containing protein n=1 Tax=Microbacterium suwonense TaxID=683047 RepID=A0ABM8FX90_9MICO|nr:hypothetical protein [Microbacterium suwonense]BDZ40182.1 hypothetical protein GCM10025863_27960 [Microbacterium suwonense]
MSDPQQPAQPPYANQHGQHQQVPANAYGLHPYASSPTAAGAGSLGRTAFIFAVITAVLGLLFAMATPFVISGLRAEPVIYQLFTLMHSILSLVLGALALILGIVAARRGSQPVLAGIAIGVGAIEVLGTLTGFVSSLMFSVLY